MVFVNVKHAIIKKVYLFQLVALEICAIMKTVYCFNWLPWASAGSSHWEVFLEIKLNQKTFKFYTSWVHWKNQCRSNVRKYALLRNKHEYQHSADIFVKNIFNQFPGFGLFLYFMKYIRKPEVSWYFQGALKWNVNVPWNKSHLIFSYLFGYPLK